MRINASVLTSLLEEDLSDEGYSGHKAYPGQSSKQYAMATLLDTLTKKYLEGKSSTSIAGDSRALDLFLKINENCKNFMPGGEPSSLVEDVALGEAKAFLYDFFYPQEESRWKDVIPFLEPQLVTRSRDFILSMPEIEQTVGCGPGKSVGVRSNDFYTKFATSTLTTTDPSLHMFYMQTIRDYPIWNDCEVSRSAIRGIRVVSGSRLSFVPKTSVISRTICTEPLLNMFFQKGVQGALERRMREVIGIDLSNQPDENAELARIGSITGRFGTIDLSSASDSMSISLVRDFFPIRVFDTLMRMRSPITVLPDGREIELHMISSMGNAFTFPLQTIFFSALVYGAYKVCGIKPVHFRGRSHGRSNFAVFGDDIIVESRAYRLISRLLHLTGFSVNVDKSFNEGLFRESCGHDFYCGHDVRGVYLRTLYDVNDLYSAINRLNRWSARNGIILKRLVSFLSSKCRFLPVPYDEDDSCGIKVPLFLLTFREVNRYTGGIKYRFSQILPLKIALPPKKKAQVVQIGYFDNPSGLLLALLAGYIRAGSIGIRSTERRRASIRERWSSRWDFIPSARGESREFRYAWKGITAINLGKV